MYQIRDNYMKSHKEINTRMRAILVDWLVDIHDKFRLTQETLFLAVSILDRFLAVSHSLRKIVLIALLVLSHSFLEIQ